MLECLTEFILLRMANPFSPSVVLGMMEFAGGRKEGEGGGQKEGNNRK